MFDIMISKKDIAAVRDYIENKGLVVHMNDAGLGMGAMALVLNAVLNECDRIEKEMEAKENATYVIATVKRNVFSYPL